MKDIRTTSPTASSSPRNFTTVGNRVFFTANGLTSGNELWVTDGTEAGTVMLKNLQPAAPSRFASNLVDLNGTLLFRATGGPNNAAELWKSDGTVEGTVLVKQLASFGGIPGSESLVRAGNFVYFAAAEPESRSNRELWKTDGTTAGTTRVKDIFPGANLPSDPQNLLAAGNRVFFSALDNSSGRELWVSDGTDAGTTRVLDVAPGQSSSNAVPWSATGGRVFFTANDPTRGVELWSTDGTAGGTLIVEDVNGGAASSNPRWPTAVRNRLVFWADDGLHGAEPMAVPLPGAPRGEVVGRHVFYNDSAFDGSDAAPNAADDHAVASDKAALLPGQAASFSNVTGYSRGINGIMIDFAGELPLTALAGIAGSLGLRMGRAGDPSGWADAPRPSQIAIRPGAGVNGSDRVTLVWPDGAIRNTWLQVTVRATPQSMLGADDVFTVGNLSGETGDAGGPLAVGAADVLATRAALSAGAAAIDNRFDHNRDGVVNVLDYSASLRNLSRALGTQPTPIVTASVGVARGAGRPTRRTLFDDGAARHLLS